MKILSKIGPSNGIALAARMNMTLPRVDVEAHPGVIDLLDKNRLPQHAAGGTVGSVYFGIGSLMMLECIQGTSFFSELLHLQKDVTLETDKAADSFERSAHIFTADPEPFDYLAVSDSLALPGLTRLFRRRKVVTVDTDEVALRIGLYWIDVPTATGARATLTVERGLANEEAARFKIIGNGIGGALTVRVRDGTGYTTTSPHSLSQNIRVKVERRQVMRGNDIETDFFVISPVDSPLTEWSAIPTHEFPSVEPLQLEEEIFNNDGSGILTKDLAIERGASVDLSYGVAVPKLGLDLSLGVTGIYNSRISYRYELPHGRYSARRFAGLPMYRWAT